MIKALTMWLGKQVLILYMEGHLAAVGKLERNDNGKLMATTDEIDHLQNRYQQMYKLYRLLGGSLPADYLSKVMAESEHA